MIYPANWTSKKILAHKFKDVNTDFFFRLVQNSIQSCSKYIIFWKMLITLSKCGFAERFAGMINKKLLFVSWFYR